ncbi:hypothetical protein [Nocardia asteroides]|uniref:hypothetical protein n=1 Tax=Nocardia asteroides TaxID=1824 RepID=UPI00365F6247
MTPIDTAYGARGDDHRVNTDHPVRRIALCGSAIHTGPSSTAWSAPPARPVTVGVSGRAEGPRDAVSADLRSAAAELLAWLGFTGVVRNASETVTAADQDSVPGFILRRGRDGGGHRGHAARGVGGRRHHQRRHRELADLAVGRRGAAAEAVPPPRRLPRARRRRPVAGRRPAFLARAADRFFILSTGHSTTGLDAITVIDGRTVRLTHPPADLVFDEK